MNLTRYKITITTMNHTRYKITTTTMNHTRYKNVTEELLIIQSVDYSDYDYQPEEGRSLGAEDEYYEDIAPARAYNFQFQVNFSAKCTFVLDLM